MLRGRWTALELAASGNHTRVFGLLIAAGADVEEKDKNGYGHAPTAAGHRQ
jgi:hypothetical protein